MRETRAPSASTTIAPSSIVTGSTMPADAKVLAAQALANTVISVPIAYTCAISVEQSTGVLMARLLQTTHSADVAALETLIRTTSLGPHTTVFAAEQTSFPPPAPAFTPTTRTQRVVPFTTSNSALAFMTLLADETVDVVEMAAGTYHLHYRVIHIDRGRPVVVRPAAGATVVLSGAGIGADPQFWFGLNGRAGNVTMQGLVFDSFVLGQQGVVQARDCHDITLNDMVVRNTRANATLAKPYHSWAVYLDATPTAAPSNFTANRWTVECSARGMSGLQVRGGSHVTALGWSVSDAWYAVYAIPSYGSITDFVLDNWTINNTGAPVWASANASVYLENCSGRFSNMDGTGSGALLNVGNPKMTDKGGNFL